MKQLELSYLVAQTQLGQKEIVGLDENPQIIEYHQSCTLQASKDEVAWCSAFVNWCYIIAGYLLNPVGMHNALSSAKFEQKDIKDFYKSAILVNKSLRKISPDKLEQMALTNILVKLPTRSAAARSWLNFGIETTTPKIGDLVIFQRGNDGWSGHVAYYKSSGLFFVDSLGGNQNNEVNISAYSKFRVLGYRTENV